MQPTRSSPPWTHRGSPSARLGAAAVAAALAMSVGGAPPVAASQPSVDPAFSAARDSVYAAAYVTQKAAREGFRSVAVDSTVNVDGSVQLSFRTEAHVSGYSAPPSLTGAVVREFGPSPGDRDPSSVYGSAYDSASASDALTGWYALSKTKNVSRLDARILSHLDPSAKRVVGTVPGASDARYIPSNVLADLERSYRVPWMVDDRLWMCDQESLFDIQVSCTGTTTTVNGLQTWNFTVSTTGASFAPDTTFAIEVRANADGHIIRKSVETRQEGSGIVYRTVTRASGYFQYDVSLFRPKLQGPTTVASSTFTAIASRTVAASMARIFRKEVSRELEAAGKRLTVANAQWAVKRLTQRSVNWWRPVRTFSIWVQGSGFTSLDEGTFQLSAVSDDGLTETESVAQVSVENGRFHTRMLEN